MRPADGLEAAVRSGDHLVALKALRDRLAADMEATESARDVAALGRLLADVLAQIAAIERTQVKREGTVLDQLAARREDRESATSGRSRAR